MKKFRKLLVAAVTGICTGAVPLTVQAAGSDISDYVVSSITTSTTQVADYDIVTYTLTFDEDYIGNTADINIAEGDYITVTWPTSGTTYFVGSTATKDVVIESTGDVIGQAVITSTGVTVTFNSTVENYQHVTGYVTFEGTVRQEEGSSGTLVVSSGSQTSTITTTPAAGENPPFGDKYGAFGTDSDGNTDYTTVYWSIRLNRTLETITDTVTVTETIPDGMTYVGLTDLSLWNENSWYYDNSAHGSDAATMITDFGGTYTYADGVLTLTLPATMFQDDTYESSVTQGSSGNLAMVIMLECTVSDVPYGTIVYNNVGLTYTSEESNYVETSITGNIYFPTSSTGATGNNLGVIELTKNVSGTSVAVEGVTFRIRQLDSDGSYVSGWVNDSDYVDITTGSDGIARVSGLEDATYEIEEISAPAYVVLLTEKVQVVISDSSTSVSQTINNSIVTKNVEAEKIWLTASGSTDTSTHPTIWFQLYRSIDGGSEELVEDSLTELPNGTETVVWNNLPAYDDYGNAYTYTVREVDEYGNDDTPDGYTKTENGLTVTNTLTPATSTPTPISTPVRLVPNTADKG